MKKSLSGLSIILSLALQAQHDSLSGTSPISGTDGFKFSAYADLYYAYDFAQPANHLRPSFLYTYNRHNEVNLNLGYIMATYKNAFVRGNLALMSGTYAQYNLASESSVFQHVLEAMVGLKVSKKHNLWVDAGIMPSHIGFEGYIGKNCWTLSRGILAENSPYYESGIKLGYTSQNNKLFIAALYLNGWQHIQRPDGNQTPAFGTQVSLTPNAKTKLNWSTFVGNEFPDSSRKWRYFNNFYGQFQLGKRVGLIAGFDIGLQQTFTGSISYHVWYTPNLILRYLLSDNLHIALRGEYYADPDQVIINTGKASGFKTYGYSLNLDYQIRENILWRIEARGFQSMDNIFIDGNSSTNSNFCLTTALLFSF
ncbi:MAG TPA: porin [Bacteroidia bacterium]|nr:porin [Bacteroidia bacterium]